MFERTNINKYENENNFILLPINYTQQFSIQFIELRRDNNDF